MLYLIWKQPRRSMIHEAARNMARTVDTRPTYHSPPVANRQGFLCVDQVNLADHDVADAVPAWQLAVQLIWQDARPRMLRKSAQNLHAVVCGGPNHGPPFANRHSPVAVRQVNFAEDDVSDAVASGQLLVFRSLGRNLDRGNVHKSAADNCIACRRADYGSTVANR